MSTFIILSVVWMHTLNAQEIVAHALVIVTDPNPSTEGSSELSRPSPK